MVRAMAKDVVQSGWRLSVSHSHFSSWLSMVVVMDILATVSPSATDMRYYDHLLWLIHRPKSAWEIGIIR